MAKATAVKSPSKSAAKKAPRTVAVRVVDVSDKPLAKKSTKAVKAPAKKVGKVAAKKAVAKKPAKRIALPSVTAPVI